jgi:ADP-ribose pyrophosphatase YjhB (NUDIX family)
MTSVRPPGYVSDVRARIGHELLLLPAVSVHVHDDAGRILLVHQIDRQTWGTVGGAVEPGEAPRDAAVRETLEETGLEVDIVRLVDALGGPEFAVTYPNGDRCSFVSIVYEARVVGGRLRPDGREVSHCAWFTREELPSLSLGGVSRAVLEAVGQI